MAENCGKNAIGIARVDGKRRNLLAVNEAEVGPSLARVDGLVDTVPNGKIWPVQPLAAADIDNVGIGGSNGNGADRLCGLVFEDWVPGATVVIGLPDATVYLSDIKHIRLAGNASSGTGTATTKRSDHAPVQLLISIFGNLRRTRGCG